MRADLHLWPRPSGRWAVRRTGATHASRVLDDQAAAILWATARASRVFVHGRGGVIERVIDG